MAKCVPFATAVNAAEEWVFPLLTKALSRALRVADQYRAAD